jgi:hypothetical protein
MKIILLGIAIFIALLIIFPDLRNAKIRSDPPAQAVRSSPPAQTAATPVATTSQLPPQVARPIYRSLLGQSGGLGTATVSDSMGGTGGGTRVYTLRELERDLPTLSEQVVRVRMSRPSYHTYKQGSRGYSVSFTDRDGIGTAVISFPEEGVIALDLDRGLPKPGLTFYVLVTQGELRAVGREWRQELRVFKW